MIKDALMRSVRIAAASGQAVAWLVMACMVACVMVCLMLCAFTFIIGRIAFNAPMLVWQAANNKAPRP